MSHHPDPRTRRHLTGLHHAAEQAEATALDGAVRLELATEDWRARVRSEVQDAAELLDRTQTEDFPAADSSSGPPAAELAANLPVRLPCTCHPEHHRWECLASCQACMSLPEDQECPAQLVWQAAQAAGDGGQAPGPGPAPAAPGLIGATGSWPTYQGRALAWASNHDPRSLDYLVRERLARPVPLQDIAREHGPILDQGTVPPLSLHDGSSCTGNMAVNLRNMIELACAPAHAAAATVPMLAEEDALAIYEAAQQLDEWPGDTYPGTSVLAVMKAGQAAGWWSAYYWARGTRDIAQALLQVGGVGIGVPFLEGMANPGPDGIVSASGRELGGHALALYRLQRVVAGRPGPWFGALQSYGPGVGDGGTIWIHATDLARLLAGTGEAAIPVVAGMLP